MFSPMNPPTIGPRTGPLHNYNEKDLVVRFDSTPNDETSHAPVRRCSEERNRETPLVVVPYVRDGPSCERERARAEEAAEEARYEEGADVLRHCTGDVEH